MPRRPRLNPPKVVFTKKEIPRFQSRVSPKIEAIARRFSGRNVQTVKNIASFVFSNTTVRDYVDSRDYRATRTAEQVIQNRNVDLLHCYDRSHTLLAILTAKRVPAWIVLEMDWQNFMHSYVEAKIGQKIYSVVFKTFEPPLVLEGRVETALPHTRGSAFVRARDLGQIGLRQEGDFEKIFEQIKEGKLKGTIIIK